MSPNFARDAKLDRAAAVADLRRYLDTILPAGRFDLRFRIDLHEPAASQELETPEIVVKFEGPDAELLLERGAELLKALEYIAVRWLRLDPGLHDRVRFDCGNYRADRLAELKLSAQVAAERVRETHAPFRFNPMSPRERRILHLVLQEQAGVRTASEGAGEERCVVVLSAESK
jgi:spoIIIJ-associated protein